VTPICVREAIMSVSSLRAAALYVSDVQNQRIGHSDNRSHCRNVKRPRCSQVKDSLILSARTSMTSDLLSQDSKQWYAIWTRSRHESVVRQQLTHKSIEAFLPTIARWSRWKDRRKKIDWPLFPGYCFARFNTANRLAVLQCSGILNIVSCEGKPVPVHEHEINSLKTLMNTELRFDPCALIREGAMVEVVGGPLRGVVGRLLRKDSTGVSVVLSVDLIGHAVRIEVDAADVKAL
jgi:transcription termination/antitermination protein NusG